MPDESSEKKVHVDEDWKSQVEAEKEALHHEQQAASPQTESPAGESEDNIHLPPPSLTFVVSSFYLQVMMSLGMLPAPGSDRPEVRLDAAKHAIDTIQMLYEKTEGNRTAEESDEIDRILHECRMAFVQVQTGQQQMKAAKQGE